jgi:catechol 2,3-dioxygenase-like lactoylglutathione lyase family enzyme
MLQHVSLEVRRGDAAGCVEFFELLGFHEVEPPEGIRGTSLWVQRGATQVHFLFADEPVIPPKGHAAVVVGDYDAVAAALTAAGHEVDERPRHWGSARAFVRMPAGHRVEIMAAPPPG